MRLLLLFVLVACNVPNVEPKARVLRSYSAANYKESMTMFAKKSFKVIAKNRTGNFIYSPVGAAITLTMAAFGAKNETAMETRAGLALPDNDLETLNEIRTMLSYPDTPQALKVRVASKIFTPELYRPRQDFINMIQWVFKSQCQAVDFFALSAACHVVNEWCEEETGGRIKEIIDPSMVTRDTELLLLTTGFIESNWRLPFESKWTTPSPFYFNGNRAEDITTMFVTGFFPHGNLYQLNATFVELPFMNTLAGEGLSMYVILPDTRDGLTNLLENFDKIDMLALMSGTGRGINVYLPKFKFESSLLLRKPLESLGFRHMFDLEANFGGITSREERLLRVSNVIQKAHINVYESNNRAEPAVGTDLLHLNVLENFRVDHPFVCVIMKDDGIPLFITVVNAPRYPAPKGYRRPFDGHWVWPLH